MSEKNKVVLVGCGGISNAWLTSLKEFNDVEIVGLVDLNQDNANAQKQKYSLESAETGSDLKEMLEAVNPAIVFDCTIPEAHFNVTTSALRHGCHVLGEKPMTTSMEQAGKMTELATGKGLIYAVIQNRRYDKSIIAFRDLIHSKKIGDLTTLNADFYLGCHFGGFRDEMDHVLLLDMAIHSFDQARFISGKDPVKVYCKEFNPAGSWYKHGASAMVIFEMSDGNIFTYRGSWCAEGLSTSWQCDWRACCTKGSAIWDGEDKIQAEAVSGNEGFTRAQEQIEINIPELETSSHYAQIRDFLDCLKSGTAPQTVCTDNIKSLAMVHAAIESAEKDIPVNIKYLKQEK